MIKIEIKLMMSLVLQLKDVAGVIWLRVWSMTLCNLSELKEFSIIAILLEEDKNLGILIAAALIMPCKAEETSQVKKCCA